MPLDIRSSLRKNGYYIQHDAVAKADAVALKKLLSDAISQEEGLREKSASHDPLQVVCCPYYHISFIELLEDSVFPLVDEVLGASSIIYSYNNSSISPGASNFARQVHRERDYSTGEYFDSIGVLLLLDDFSCDNGATWFLPGSHMIDGKLSESAFYLSASRLLASAGTAFYFHPRLYHASGENLTSLQRDALSIGFCRPYMKQRLDLPSLLLSRFGSVFSAKSMVKIGAGSVPPKSLEEFYRRNPLLWTR